MKKIKIYGTALGISTAIIIITTLIITLLGYFNICNSSIISIIKIIIPIISLLISGILVGKKSIKKGWLEGLKFSILFMMIFLLFNYLGYNNHFEIKNLLYYIILMIACIFGSMIGISKKEIKN